jgi:hypothetical protein
LTRLAALPDEVVLAYITSPDSHPMVLDAVAVALYARETIHTGLLAHALLSSQAREFLQSHPPLVEVPPEVPVSDAMSADDLQEEAGTDDPAMPDEELQSSDDELPGEDAEDVNEEDEEYLSKYKIAQIMGISEKIKMALTGDKEWRAILVKDANKLVSGSVLKNPRITDGEILRILKLGVQSDEVIRLICANREWVKNYNIRKALIDCPKTPLANSLRYLSLLNEKDLARYAKSRNISSVLSTQAKRMVLAKQKKR